MKLRRRTGGEERDVTQGRDRGDPGRDKQGPGRKVEEEEKGKERRRGRAMRTWHTCM